MNENSGLYAWIHSLRTVRSPARWAGGVVSGIADRFGMDRTLGRALFVIVGLLLTDLAVLFYGLAWMLLPEPDGRIHARQAGRGRWTSGMTGALVLTLLGVVGVFAPPYGPDGGWWGFGGFLGLAVIGVFVWLVATRSGWRSGAQADTQAGADPASPGGVQGAAGAGAVSGTGSSAAGPVYLSPSDTRWYSGGESSEPAASPYTASPYTASPTTSTAFLRHDPLSSAQPTDPYPHPHPAGTRYGAPPPPSPRPASGRSPRSLSGSTQLLVAGLALLAGAAVALLRHLGVFTADWPVIWAAALATVLGVLAVGIIIGAIAGRGGGGLTVTSAILVVPLVIATGGSFLRMDAGGTWGGTLRGTSETGYELSFGDGVIDLTGEPGSTDPGAGPVMIDLSFATAEVIVPDDMDVYLRADDTFSSVDRPSVTEEAVIDGGRIQLVDAPGRRTLDIDADLSFSTLSVRVAEPIDNPAPESGADTTQEGAS